MYHEKKKKGKHTSFCGGVSCSLYCVLSNNLQVPAMSSCQLRKTSSTRAGDRANYENEMSVRWKKKRKKKSVQLVGGGEGKERAEGPEKFPLPHIYHEYNAQRPIPTDIAISRILTARRRVRSLRRSRSRRPLLLTRGISCRALSITPIDYFPARSPLSDSSRDRDTSFHCLAYAADKPNSRLQLT